MGDVRRTRGGRGEGFRYAQGESAIRSDKRRAFVSISRLIGEEYIFSSFRMIAPVGGVDVGNGDGRGR